MTRFVWTGTDWVVKTAEAKAAATGSGEVWRTINGARVLIGGDGVPVDPAWRARLAVSSDKMAAPTGPVPNAEAYGSQAAGHADADYHAGDARRADEEVLTRAYIDNAYSLAYVLTGHPERGETLRNWPATQSYGWKNTLYTDPAELQTLLPKEKASERIARETDLDVSDVDDFIGGWNNTGPWAGGGRLLSLAARDELGAAASRFFTSRRGYGEAGDYATKVARQMYADTQADLARLPGDTVTLYRGIKVNQLGHDPARQQAAQGKAVRTHRIDMPLSSWSLDPATARAFNSATLIARVPKSRILATWRTGLGMDREGEFVVLGGHPADQAVFVY